MYMQQSLSFANYVLPSWLVIWKDCLSIAVKSQLIFQAKRGTRIVYVHIAVKANFFAKLDDSSYEQPRALNALIVIL